MRVVQLVTQSEGGPVDHAADLAAGLAHRGIDSHVVGPPSVALTRAETAGAVWHRVHVRHKADVAGARQVVRLLRTLAPDVLHLQDRRAGLLGRTAVRSARRTHVVYTLHGVADGLSDLVSGNVRAAPRRRRDGFYYLTLERVLARWGGGPVVVPSRAVARFAVDHVGLPERQVVVVPNGVDADRFRPSEPSEPGGHGGTTLAWVGGMVPVKRPDLLVDALAQLPAVRATMVGGGPLAADVGARAHDLGVTGRLRLTGRLDDPGVVLGEADVFVLTSVAENCPLALLEAMSAGLPVVVPAVGGIPEVVRDGIEGLLYPAGDVGALVTAVRRLDDPRVRHAFGRAARQRVLDHYTLDHCVDSLLRVYAGAAA